MPRRMTKTEKWEDDWFVSLEPQHKLFWFYLCDRCDHAGIWQVSKVMAERFIGQPIDLDAALEAFGDRIDASKPGYWRLTKFIEFQYGLPLGTSAVHKSVIRALERAGYDSNPFQRVAEPLPNPFQRVKDKDKDSSLDKPADDGFNAFWAAYPKKAGKIEAAKQWRIAKPPLDAVLKAIEEQKKSRQWLDGFILDPERWIKRGHWMNETNQTFDPATHFPDGRKKNVL